MTKQDCPSVKGRPPANSTELSCSRDLDLDQMTLMYELDVNILKIHNKIQLVNQGFRKVQPEQDRQTDRHNRTYYCTSFAGGNKLIR